MREVSWDLGPEVALGQIPAGVRGELDAVVVAPEQAGGDPGVEGVRTECGGHPKLVGTEHEATVSLGVGGEGQGPNAVMA
jgi:hypothetical protein